MSKNDKNGPGAVVLGANFVSLGITRSLGMHGIPVWVIDTDRSNSIAQFSRYTTRFIETNEAIPDLLLRLGREHRLDGWVLFPGNDQYVEIVSAHRESLSSIYRVTAPPVEVTKFALDKRLTHKRAEELGISVPWTAVGDSFADIEAEGVAYPVILKPAINHHFFPLTNIKALPADNRTELRRGFAQMNRHIPAEEILLQERIPGGGENQFSFCAICKEGRVRSSLVAQRRRQYPVEFGNNSTFVETTHQPVVEAAGRRFLESIGFDGIAEVEFKFDSRDGKYKILDVNLRAWGWHALGKAAGIDFPYMLWRQAVGLSVAPVNALRSAAWIREITDFVSIAKSRNPIAEVKGLLRALYSRKFAFATFSLTDPVPFCAEFVRWISSGLSRQNKAKAFLQLESVGPRTGLSLDLAENLYREGPSPDARAWTLEDVRAACSIVARVELGELETHQSGPAYPETIDTRESDLMKKPRE